MCSSEPCIALINCLTEYFFSIVAGVDFTPVVMELLFDENTAEIDVMIPIINDFVVEGEEFFTVSLARDPLDPLDEVIISPDTAIVRIKDTDRELHELAFLAVYNINFVFLLKACYTCVGGPMFPAKWVV